MSSSSIRNFASGVTGATGTTNTLISASAPLGPPAQYLWIQTGLGDSGTNVTFWIEDGT